MISSRSYALLLLLVATSSSGCGPRPWKQQERETREMMAVYDEAGITPERLAKMQPAPILTYTRSYHPETGQLALERRIELHSDGRIVNEGPDREWYADGTPKSRCSFAQGVPDGVWQTFHPNGSLESEVVMSSDEPEIATWWYASGAIKARGLTSRGTKQGAWTHFHENGNPAEQGPYQEGLRSGTWRLWWEDGTPRAVGRYEHGRREGEWTYWSRDGDPLGPRDG